MTVEATDLHYQSVFGDHSIKDTAVLPIWDMWKTSVVSLWSQALMNGHQVVWHWTTP